jgi:tRNA-2-methylthio-N6-dimethylallyladenosine synthase
VKRFYIETLGCQMNKLDSELVAGMLERLALQPTARPEEADVALLNTCSVREHAEQKALSRLGHLDHLRRRTGKPLVIAVMGCFAQRAARSILTQAPFVDIVCGPNQLHELGAMVDAAWAERCRTQKPPARVAVEDFRKIRSGRAMPDETLEALDLNRPVDGKHFQRFVRAQRGCDKFCAYCVVPYVRGPERSRPVDHILEEVRRIDQTGCREITLIGQTVSSYRSTADGRPVDLPELLRRVHDACSIPRIRFITSYPADFPLDLFRAMAELPRICPYLHLPAQHGADRMLALMNRKYTVEEYLQILDQGRRIVPSLSVAGDFIVGFPTETEEDHAASVALVEKVRYKNCFIFKYSARPGTAAEKRFKDDVPAAVKSRRLAQMLEVQDRIAAEDNRRMIGCTPSILVEGRSKKNRGNEERGQLVGRTVEDKMVIFEGPVEWIGRVRTVRITSASSLTLFGAPDDPKE